LSRAIAVRLLTLTFLVAGISAPPAAQAPQSALRVLSREGVRALPTVTLNSQEYVALDDLSQAFGLTSREDQLAGGITVTAAKQSIIITPDQPVVSVAGRLVSLNAAPTKQGNRWLLPLDFLPRALGPALQTRIDLRRASRLLIVGDLRVPRVAARIDPSPAGTTVTFDATPATPSRITLETGRLIVLFEADALEFVPPANVPNQDFLQAVQAGDVPAAIRVVTGPKFGLHRATTSQHEPNTSRVAIALLPPSTNAPAAPGASANRTEPVAPGAPDAPVAPVTPGAPVAPGAPVNRTAPDAPDAPVAPVAPAGIRTIVIDAGHGGDDTGVRGGRGTLEKDVTLAIARRLKTMIESRLGLRVFMTREDDRAMSLDERSAYANSQKADLFLSIHANAAVRPAMEGAEIYYLSLDPGSAEARRLAESSGDVLPALGGGTRSIDLILWESAQSRFVEQSSMLAGLVEEALRPRVKMSPRAIQAAPFRVLVGANMPAVLVEVGYLTNAGQESALTGGAFQDQIAQAMFDAIVQFRTRIESANKPAAQPVRPPT
jgi:N-acetylmuramoyl-L-alanine amidase